MPSSGFGHGSEVGVEGLLQERIRKMRGCMCKENGGWPIYGDGMSMGTGGGG